MTKPRKVVNVDSDSDFELVEDTKVEKPRATVTGRMRKINDQLAKVIYYLYRNVLVCPYYYRVPNSNVDCYISFMMW